MHELYIIAHISECATGSKPVKGFGACTVEGLSRRILAHAETVRAQRLSSTGEKGDFRQMLIR